MILNCDAFKEGGVVPMEYTCDGANIHPAFSFSDIPLGAKSLAIVMSDIDSYQGEWVHWLLWNISPNIGMLEEGEVPEGAIEGMTDFNTATYGGPCPKDGQHRYVFHLYALDTELSLEKGRIRSEFESAIVGHVLAEDSHTGVYQRQEAQLL